MYRENPYPYYLRYTWGELNYVGYNREALLKFKLFEAGENN